MCGDLLSRGDMLEDFEGDISALPDKFAIVLTVMLERDIGVDRMQERITHINEPRRAKEEVVHTPAG